MGNSLQAQAARSGQVATSIALFPVALQRAAGYPWNDFEFEMIRFCVVRRKLKIRLVNFVGMFIKPIPSKTNTKLK